MPEPPAGLGGSPKRVVSQGYAPSHPCPRLQLASSNEVSTGVSVPFNNSSARPSALSLEEEIVPLPAGLNVEADCTESDTSGLVEHTQAIETMVPKELGKLAP